MSLVRSFLCHAFVMCYVYVYVLRSLFISAGLSFVPSLCSYVVCSLFVVYFVIYLCWSLCFL